jgi:hypothetical protein
VRHMLRAVLGKVEDVPSSSSMPREAARACDHRSEPACGRSAIAIQTVALSRPEVGREGSRNWGAGTFLRRSSAPTLPSGNVRLGPNSCPLRSALGACKDPGPNRSRSASGSRLQSCQRKSRPTRRLQRTLTLSSTVAACGCWRLRVPAVAFDQRR